MSNIQKPNLHFDVVTYTGNGATNNVTGLSFTPDLVWIKSRSAATDHAVYDAVRGTTKDLVTNSNAAETTQSTGLTAFNSNGFTVGSLAKLNTNAATYVAWCWNAGGTTVTNTDGTITSQVRANPTAGFSVVNFTPQSSGTATVGHGLGVAPAMFITKTIATAGTSWSSYHKSLGATQVITLSNSNASGTNANAWNSTSPTSSVITLGTAFAGLGAQIFYCFAEVEGFSKFGSYVGNGNANGPFVYLGFRPRFLLYKRSDSSGGWGIVDAARNQSNLVNLGVNAEANIVESATYGYKVDFLSNGFKLRDASGNNVNGATYIYAAFAEAPFENSLAR